MQSTGTAPMGHVVALAISTLAMGCILDTGNGKDSGGSGSSGSSTGGTTGGSSTSTGSSGSGGDPGIVDVDCDNPPDAPMWDAGTCITDELACGESITAVNTGGPSMLDGSEYASFWACAVVGNQDYEGSEQHFFFTHPGTGDVTIGLDSPCEDLDLFVIRWDGGSCVREGLSIIECDGAVGSGGGSVTIWNNTPSGYVIVVDGPKGEEGPYAVSLTCP